MDGFEFVKRFRQYEEQMLATEIPKLTNIHKSEYHLRNSTSSNLKSTSSTSIDSSLKHRTVEGPTTTTYTQTSTDSIANVISNDNSINMLSSKRKLNNPNGRLCQQTVMLLVYKIHSMIFTYQEFAQTLKTYV